MTDGTGQIACTQVMPAQRGQRSGPAYLLERERLGQVGIGQLDDPQEFSGSLLIQLQRLTDFLL